MKNGFLMLAVIALFAPHGAQAASKSAGSHSFDGHLGLTLPVIGDLDDAADPGFMFGGDWLYYTQPDLAFGAGVDFTYFGDGKINSVTTSLDMISIQGLVRKNLRSTGPSEPYLNGGFGFTSTDLDVSNSFASASESDTSPSFFFGGGLDFPLNNGLFAGFNIRYQHYFFDIGNLDGGGAFQLLGQIRW